MMASSPRLALYRARRRQRGAAVFLVVLVLTMLGAMGIFASRAAGLTEAAAGYDRTNQQTQYVAELGMGLTAAEVGRTSEAVLNIYRQRMQGKAGYAQVCSSGQWFSNTSLNGYSYPCQPFDSTTVKLTNATTAQAISPATYAPGPGPGSLTNPDSYIEGSLGQSPVSALFSADLSDLGPYPGTVPGTNVGTTGAHFGYVMGTVGIVGQVSPLVANVANCTAGVDDYNALVASRLTGRGYVVIGPTLMPSR